MAVTTILTVPSRLLRSASENERLIASLCLSVSTSVIVVGLTASREVALPEIVIARSSFSVSSLIGVKTIVSVASFLPLGIVRVGSVM